MHSVTMYKVNFIQMQIMLQIFQYITWDQESYVYLSKVLFKQHQKECVCDAFATAYTENSH